MADQPRIFVSHSHQDNDWCRPFVGELQRGGWDVWYDEKGLSGGSAWVATIQRELQAREIFLLVLSPDAWASRWVRDELDLALVTHHHIIPVHHRTTQADGFILARQWVQVVGLPGAEAARKVIADALVPLAASIAQPSAQAPAGRPPAPVLPESSPALPSLGPAPVPQASSPALHLTPTALYSLGFRGYAVRGVECVLPPVCPVPGGVFTMGSDKARDKDARDDETPQYPVQVGDFAVGQHPVTVAEYACAVRAKAVREPPEAYKTTWATQLQRLDHPVVCVSWQDALAYVRWLAKVTGQSWRLPTEAEWEKAARGTDGRIYPWGDAFDKTKCNTDASGIGTTTPVGRYPGGASPCQAQDMAGNVWEWTSSLYKNYAYNAGDGREDLNSTGNRVLRGGSWVNNPTDARAAFRRNLTPDLFYIARGFRVVLSAAAGS